MHFFFSFVLIMGNLCHILNWYYFDSHPWSRTCDNFSQMKDVSTQNTTFERLNMDMKNIITQNVWTNRIKIHAHKYISLIEISTTMSWFYLCPLIKICVCYFLNLLLSIYVLPSMLVFLILPLSTLQRLLICNPSGRMSAEEGMLHQYFGDLDPSIKLATDNSLILQGRS